MITINYDHYKTHVYGTTTTLLLQTNYLHHMNTIVMCDTCAMYMTILILQCTHPLKGSNFVLHNLFALDKIYLLALILLTQIHSNLLLELLLFL